MFEKKVRQRMSRLGRHGRYCIRNFLSFLIYEQAVGGCWTCCSNGKNNKLQKNFVFDNSRSSQLKIDGNNKLFRRKDYCRVEMDWYGTAFFAMTELNLVTLNDILFSPQNITEFRDMKSCTLADTCVCVCVCVCVCSNMFEKPTVFTFSIKVFYREF